MDENFEPVRLAIAVLIGGLAAFAMHHENRENPTEIGCAAVGCTIAAYMFFKVVIGIAVIVATIFFLWRLGPSLIRWSREGARNIHAEVNTQRGQRSAPRLASPHLADLRKVVEDGAPKEVILDQIKFLEGDGRG